MAWNQFLSNLSFSFLIARLFKIEDEKSVSFFDNGTARYVYKHAIASKPSHHLIFFMSLLHAPSETIQRKMNRRMNRKSLISCRQKKNEGKKIETRFSHCMNITRYFSYKRLPSIAPVWDILFLLSFSCIWEAFFSIARWESTSDKMLINVDDKHYFSAKIRQRFEDAKLI